jgi:hypothetical protein
MAIRARVPVIDYEAVWAICLYLKERRQKSTAVTVRQPSEIWLLVLLQPRLTIEKTEPAQIVCVVDADASRVLAFRVVSDNQIDDAIALTLYDAVTFQRKPSPDGAAGLEWQLPAQIHTDLKLNDDLRRSCAKLGICVNQSSRSLPLLGILRNNEWASSLTQRALTKEMVEILFDNYLAKIHGYSPSTAAQDRYREFAGTVGYFRNPEWQFPALRDFLPVRRASIEPEGVIVSGGLKYYDDLLAWFPGQPVTVRKTAPSDDSIWVYLDDEILCQALILNRSSRGLIADTAQLNSVC